LFAETTEQQFDELVQVNGTRIEVSGGQNG
jgi:hypothetical protein